MFSGHIDIVFNPHNYHLYRGNVFDIPKYFNENESKRMLEIYRKTLSLFRYVGRIRPDSLRVNILKKGRFGSRLNPGGIYPEIDLVKDLDSINPRVIDRCFLRCGLDKSQYTEEEIAVIFRDYAMAHELGHLIQGPTNDTMFKKMFGEDFDKDAFIFLEYENYDDREYGMYLKSDAEVNADFIALHILGNWNPDMYTSPLNEGFTFEEWRKWGNKHTLEWESGKIKEVNNSGMNY